MRLVIFASAIAVAVMLAGQASANLQNACTVAKIEDNGTTTTTTVDVDSAAVAQEIRAAVQPHLQQFVPSATIGQITFSAANATTLGIAGDVTVPGLPVTPTVHVRLAISVVNGTTAHADLLLDRVVIPATTVNVGPVQVTVPSRTIPLQGVLPGFRQQLTLPPELAGLQSIQIVNVTSTWITATITTSP